MTWRFCSIVLAVSILCIGSILYAPRIIYDAPQSTHVPRISKEQESIQKEEPLELFFVGDIMLGRAVETRMIEEGAMYPFMEVRDILSTPDVTIGNFEGVVSEEHVHAPSMTFQFSIRNEYLTTLKQVGFDVLSLANNHSFDYGLPAFNYTRALCKELEIVCGGSPGVFDTHSVQTRTVGKENITFVFLHTTWNAPSDESLDILLKNIATSTGIQVAYIHWGDEYMLTHSASQQVLAKKLIDRGVDVVMGHHPHVVQDVGMYKGKPIFYSLGNFIFDQYFSDDVQEGLGVHMHVDDAYITYILVPFTSKESRNQPRLMGDVDAERIIARILSPIIGFDGVDHQKGVISVAR